jgi:hypothetical protein
MLMTAQRVSRIRGQLFLHHLDLKRFSRRLSQQLAERHSLSVSLDDMQRMAAEAAGFTNLLALAAEADSGGKVAAPASAAGAPAFTSQARFAGPWIAPAFAGVHHAFKDLLHSAAHPARRALTDSLLAVGQAASEPIPPILVLGAFHGARLDIVEPALELHAEHQLVDLARVTPSDLIELEHSQASLIAFDRASHESGSARWALDYAYRHPERQVVLLLDDPNYARLAPVNPSSDFTLPLFIVDVDAGTVRSTVVSSLRAPAA